MLEKFNQNKILLKSEKYDCYNDLITIIHIFIFYLYDDCYYDETKRKSVEYIIKHEYPVNLLTKTNESILHTLFDDGYNKVANNDRAEAFISFLLTSTNFKHLNLKTKSTLLKENTFTPLSLAVRNKRRVGIIKLLLDNGSTIGSPDLVKWLNSKYPSLNVYQKYVTLQSLSAAIINENNNNNEKRKLPLPTIMQKFVKGCN